MVLNLHSTPDSPVRLLLVDDDADFAQMLARALGAAGMVVTVAGDGRQALQQLQRNDFDALVLDVVMPEMDGIESLHRLRALRPQLPVVVISGGGRLTPGCYLPAARRLGAKATLEKPFAPDILARLLQSLVRDQAKGLPTATS